MQSAADNEKHPTWLRGSVLAPCHFCISSKLQSARPAEVQLILLPSDWMEHFISWLACSVLVLFNWFCLTTQYSTLQQHYSNSYSNVGSSTIIKLARQEYY